MIYDFVTVLFVVSGLALFTTVFCGAIYYLFIREKYNALLQHYASRNFQEPLSSSWFRQFGLLGVYGTCGYFRKLLKGKKIPIGHKKYLDNGPYQFAKSLDKSEYAWFYKLMLFTKLVDIFIIIWLISFSLTELLSPLG
ncbi:hypothetical protein [Serratia rhizosphaerae]|uniref:Uncharacterized protein n=1 Tax=Serratia rhizosphaerae TaxID=2597702 RepID=A0ABX6GHV0_9GAMM|nr:hypothetical protein [Serratia rhizosphaerae]MEB6335053.1 hypothetical protein [Serratia rhizosphaerae]QHA85841.1 hypothetical protein FO014_01980 [Serratia rhizosphaerae]